MKVTYEFEEKDRVILEIFSRGEDFYDALQEIDNYLNFTVNTDESLYKEFLNKVQEIINQSGIHEVSLSGS